MAFEIRLLGPIEVLHDGVALAVAGKERTILALLAVRRGDRVSEDHLIEAVWGSAEPPRTARRTLHAYVSRLRRTLAVSDAVRIETVELGYRLSVDEAVIDVDVVAELVAQADALDGGLLVVDLLRRAEGMWHGDSLGHLAAEPVLQPEAVRLDGLRWSIVEDRVFAGLAAGLHADLTAELEQMTAAHPLRERLWEALITALYRSGRQADALRAYQQVRNALDEELGIEPGSQLRALELAVLNQDPDLDWSAPAVADGPPPADVPREGIPGGEAPTGRPSGRLQIPLARMLGRRSRMPCVGRSAELARLRAAWESSCEGRPTAVLLAGAPGVGKTRLAAELAQQVHAEGGLVLYGTCDEGVVVPYQPFAEGLAHLVRHAPQSRLPTLLGRGAGELTTLVPGLAAVVPALPDRTVSEPETERFRLLQAVTAWVEATSAEVPVLLVLDDLHWAGPATLHVLSHLLTHLDTGRACIVGTYRDSEVSANQGLATMLAASRRYDDVRRIEVVGLDEEGSAALVTAFAGVELDLDEQRLAAMVHVGTEGNPFFIEEVLRHLVDTGAVHTAADGHWLSSEPPATIGLPDSVREVVTRRLAGLPAATLEVLGAASVVGQDVPYDMLEELTGGIDVTSALSAAIDARLVEDASDSRSLRYRFTHALVQATLYQGLPAPYRVRVHAEVAAAYERLGPTGSHLRELAYHYVQAAPAGYQAQALNACLRAGHAALSSLAFEAAALHFERALGLIHPGRELDELAVAAPPAEEPAADAGEHGSGPASRLDEGVQADAVVQARAAALLGLAESRFRMGRPDFRAPLEQAWEVTDSLDSFEWAEGAALACSRGYWGNFVKVDEARVAAIERAIALCPAEREPARARLQAELAAELMWDDDRRDHYTELADGALAVARGSGDDAMLATVLARRLTTFWDLDRNAERYAVAAEGLELALRLGDPVLQVQFATYGIFCAVESADEAMLDPLRDILEGLTSELGQPVWDYSIHYALISYHTVRSGPKELESCCQRALELGLGMGLEEAPFLALVETGGIHWWRDTYEEVVELIEPIVDDYVELVTMRTWIASIFARTGRRAKAQSLLEGFKATRFDVGNDHSKGIALAECALTAADLGDRDAAAMLIPILEPYRHLVLRNPVNAAGPATWFIGRLHETLGEWEAADLAFTAAEASCRRMRGRMWLAHLQMDRAEALVARGVTDDGTDGAIRRLAGEALTIALDLDLPGIARRAERLVTQTPA